MNEQSEWRKARKKPVVIEFREVRGGMETIQTREGVLEAVWKRHYIIRGVEGELYPIERGVFEQTYEILPVDEFWTCFSCLHDFKPTDFCERCGWAKCTHCFSCLCTISKAERRVAIAVWLSHAQVPPDTKKRFLEIAKRGLPHD